MANFQSAHLRPVVSKFGGMITESNAVAIPPQAKIASPKESTSFIARHKATTSNVYAGIPGYMGYRPHGSHPTVMGDREAPAPHARPMAELDTSKQPYIMPVVGYSGHIRRSVASFGTSKFKNSGQVTGNKAAASKPWDGRDCAGRPYGGQAPSDFGRYEADPDIEQKKREAAEANEILELRSMGIRALLSKKPDWAH